MSKPKRYHLEMQKADDGDWVLYEDYARLKAEVERLTAIVGADAIDREHGMCCDASAQVERLTKAGDELHAFLINYIVESRISSAYLNKLDDGWLAAKEGKPSA